MPGSQAQILAAYRGMWAAYVEAAKISDYGSTRLARYSAGQARSSLVRGLYNNAERGLVIRGTPVFRPRVTRVAPPDDPARAEVLDCADDSGWRTYDKNGRPVGAKPRGKSRIEAGLRLFDRVWKVTELVVEKELTC